MDDFLIRNVRIADGSKKLYKQGKSGLNLCAFTAEAAMYSEFM